jgi:hypothetical protein
MPADPILHYHELLDSDHGLAAETHAALEEQLRRRGLVFGDRALCTVIRPRFIEHAALGALERRVRPLLRAFARAHEAAMARPEFRAQFGLLDWEETLIASDPGIGPSPTSRLDLFVVDEIGACNVTEYNAETPAGAAFNDALASAFIDVPAMRVMAREWSVRPLLAAHGVLHALLDAWERFSGTRARPRIAILDWEDVPTRREFELYQDLFAARGIESVIADPDSAEYAGGRLLVGGAPVDLIYKRVLISELISHGGLEHPVVRAVRDRAVCMVDPFRCKILHKKASLAVLSDEANAHLFDAESLEAVRRDVPWTRVVRERTTTVDGESIDLLPWVARHKDALVLKPNDEYGGTGIVLGWTVSDAEWEAALARALEEPYIVQRRVAIPSEPYPSMIDGALHIFDRMVDTDPFVSHISYMEGALTRLSTAALLNVTAGGGSQVPMFVVERR